MTNSDLLKDIIKKSGLKQKAVAEKMKLSPYGLQRKINNNAEFKAGEITRLCEILDIRSGEERERVFFAQQGDYNSHCGTVTA
jgi:transcriptional regulator with XRE-family HTH domain